MSTKKRILLTLSAVLPILTCIGFAVAAAVTDIFALQAVSHVILKLMKTATCVLVIYKCLKEQLGKYLKPCTVICSIILFLDMTVLSSVKYIMTKGVDTILFFPASIPLCLGTIIYCFADNSPKHKSVKKWVFIIGIPLTALAIVFEALSFAG